MLMYKYTQNFYLIKFQIFHDISFKQQNLVIFYSFLPKTININDHLRVSKVSCKFRIPTIYSFTVIYT